MASSVGSTLPEGLHSQLSAQLQQLDEERRQLTERMAHLDTRRNALISMLSCYGDEEAALRASPEGSGLSSLEMARVVLGNAGRPLPMAAIYERIQGTYGIAAKKTLKDMLWKRSRTRNIFTRYKDGTIGLVELEAVVETVTKTSHAVA
jgi:hypothetical protein